MSRYVKRGQWLAVALVALVACDKGGSKGGPGGGTVAGPAASAIDFLPKETSLAFGINVPKLKESKYYPDLINAVPAEGKEVLDHAKQSCGFDWQSDFESIIVAGGGNLDRDRAIILIKAKWDHDKVAKCASALAEKNNKKVTVTKDGSLTVIQPEGEKASYLAWPDKNTLMLTAASMQGDKAFLSDIMKKASSVKDNKTFMGLLGSTDTTSTFWFAGQLPEEQSTQMMSQLNPGGKQKLVGVYATIAFTKSLAATVGMRLDGDPKPVADKLSSELENVKKQAPQAADLLKDTTVATASNDVVIKANLTEKQVDELAQQAKQMLPGLLMMMGQ